MLLSFYIRFAFDSRGVLYFFFDFIFNIPRYVTESMDHGCAGDLSLNCVYECVCAVVCELDRDVVL